MNHYCPIPCPITLDLRIRKGVSKLSTDGVLMHLCTGENEYFPADTRFFTVRNASKMGLAGCTKRHQARKRKQDYEDEKASKPALDDEPSIYPAEFPLYITAKDGSPVMADVADLLASARYKIIEGALHKRCIRCPEDADDEFAGWHPADTEFFHRNSTSHSDPLHSWCKFCMQEARTIARRFKPRMAA